jgi:two-component system, NarL family, sensor histidine kinase UhpB
MTRTGAQPAPPVLRGTRAARTRRPTLFRRLFLTYAAVLGLAVTALIIAPVSISVPTKASELVVIVPAFAIMLLAYRALLRRALAPLEHLTDVMRRIDPLAPGARITTQASDAEVAALADAFNDMLDRLEGERRDSGRRALSAQEAERRRVARELHDEIGQLLTGLLLRSETIARRAPDDLRPDIEELREAARHAAEEVRVIARRLRPEALDELGLQSALLARCTAIRERAGIEVERHLERDLPLNAEEELVFYRVAQEALTNVVRHSGAKNASLSLGSDGAGGVLLVVRDDGRGLPPDAHRRSTGIRGMRERALLVGARLELRPVDPSGTEVRLHLPAKEET